MSQVIAIAGGSCSGKTTLAKYIQKELGDHKSQIIYQDSFYFDQSEHFDKDGGAVNFDHPSSIDFSLLERVLVELKAGNSVHLPQYDFATHKRTAETDLREPTPYIIVDGTLILSQKNLCPHFDLSCFIDCSETVRLKRRVARDIQERGRQEEGVREQFSRQVAPMHNEFIQPSLQEAREVFSGELEGGAQAFRKVALNLIHKWNLQ